jgi:hypothetical protein
MPVTVYGGSEANVLRREFSFEMHEARLVESAQSFMGFDRGDVVESTVALYNQANEVIYRRSLHKEAGDPDCYEAFDPPQAPLTNTPAKRVRLAIDCRVNGPNDVTGNLSARCHLLATLTFGGSSPPPPPPPPPPGCNIAGPDDPKWEGLGLPRTTREMLNTAKILVGDRTGHPPLETLALLAQAVRDKGGCALGPWVDEIAIQRADGHVDGWHAVAFGTGGYTSNPIGDSWRYGHEPTGCGAPIPGPLHHAKVKLFQTSPKRTYNADFLVGPDSAYCAAVGYTDGRSMCTVRPDGHPEREACEALRVGTPQWSFDGTGRCFARPNPYLYRCDDDAHGTLTVCAEKVAGVCASIGVE